jgi:hypothetical protein
MGSWLREVLSRRPPWMNALLVFCVFMAGAYIPWDIFLKSVTHDQEVWFGVTFNGWPAKLAALRDLRGGSLWLLADASLDVAVGAALCRRGRLQHVRLDGASFR